jgi:hypothetical protein
VQQRGAPSGVHREHAIEGLTRERAERPRRAHEREQVVFEKGLIAAGGNDLLGEDVERVLGLRGAIEQTRAHRVYERRAGDQFVAREREQAALRQAAEAVAGAANALQERGDRGRGADLDHEIDVADIDAEFERTRGDERLQRAGLEALLGIEAARFRQ